MGNTWWERMVERIKSPFVWLKQARCGHRIEVDGLAPGWSGGASCEKCGLAVTVFNPKTEKE